jgi:hypothetical protein
MAARVESRSSSISTSACADDDDVEELPPSPGVLSGATVCVVWANPRTGHTERRVQSKPGKGAVTLGRDGSGGLVVIAHYNDNEEVFTCKGRREIHHSIVFRFLAHSPTFSLSVCLSLSQYPAPHPTSHSYFPTVLPCQHIFFAPPFGMPRHFSCVSAHTLSPRATAPLADTRPSPHRRRSVAPRQVYRAGHGHSRARWARRSDPDIQGLFICVMQTP